MDSSQSTYVARLPLWVLLGVLLGILVGLFFGEGAAVLEPIGTVYVRSMEIVVFPYIICSLLHGLGSLSPDTAWRLFRRSWVVYVVVWGSTLLVIFLLSLAIPPVPPPSLVDATAPRQGLGLLEVLIPADPFQALASNYVPAIVVLSIVYGIAMQRIENKAGFLAILDLIRTASLRIWGWAVLLMPFGVFALFAHTAGTVEPAALAGLSLYLITMMAGTLILGLWVLPSLIAAVCPLTTREVLRDLRNALMTAVVTSLSVAAVPFIQRAAEKLADQQEIGDESRGEIIKTTLSVSYPLAQLGNFFIWLFVLFGAFYYRVALSAEEQLALPIVSLLSGIGSPTSSIDAVDFLTSWLAFPSDATGLYVSMMAVTRYGQVIASVMGFAFITFLVTLNYYGKLRLRVPRLTFALLVSAALIAVVTTGGRFIQREVIGPATPPYLTYELTPSVTRGVTAVIEKPAPPGRTSNAANAADTLAGAETPAAAGAAPDTTPAAVVTETDQPHVLARIQRTGELRVGYSPIIIPFSYENDRGELVGFDIAYVYQLARDLNVKLRLIPFEWQSLAEDLSSGRFDLAAGGIYVTDERLERFMVAEPYYQSPLALIVRAEHANRFLSREAIEARENLTIGVFDDPVLIPLARRLFPGADLKVLGSFDELPQHPDIDAALWTREQARAWALRRGEYTAVVPKDLGSPFLIAYLLPEGAVQMREFVNYWMRLQRATGFHEQQVSHWIQGEPVMDRRPRWSILRDVLGWRRPASPDAGP